MPPVGASERVDRLKMVVCCRDGCRLIAGFVAGKSPVYVLEMPINKGFFNIDNVPATKATRFCKKI